MLKGRYEGVQPERVVSFLGAHPQLMPLLEDLHCRLATAFPGARFVLRHLNSPRVPSPEGDGHLLVVVVPAAPTGDPSSPLSDLLRDWAPHSEARAFLLVDVASAVVDPYASDEEVLEVYIRRRSEDYKQYLDLARRFLEAPPGSDERALAGADLSTAHLRAQGKISEGRGGDPQEVLARLRRERQAATDAG
jgi:hypothetical protein